MGRSISHFTHRYVLLLFCVKRLVDIVKKEKVCHSKFGINGPVTLQRFSQRMPTYEKLMQNVGIRYGRKKKIRESPSLNEYKAYA